MDASDLVRFFSLDARILLDLWVCAYRSQRFRDIIRNAVMGVLGCWPTWLTTMLISIVFALVGIQDDDLGVMESALDQSPHEMTSGSHPILDVSEDAVPSTLGRPSDDEVVGNQGGTDRSSNQGEGT